MEAEPRFRASVRDRGDWAPDVWANLVLLVRINPLVTLVPVDQWKAPEWLVWPTIVAGSALIFDWGPAGEVARNLFKFFMAIYALQGLSVMGFLL